ncbi:hypothetical protein [Salinarimonas soli]|uniref:Lipoprotein n=1 Tax=Salinarimonas soli TaxID=1638099 RepID=A0A5B2VC33_9HYPH|nr:hypothetical protein [Salinarimonas soli]KAA2236534.1 hypothetical protein F0L46_14495 [Salinarimonas soli]
MTPARLLVPLLATLGLAACAGAPERSAVALATPAAPATPARTVAGPFLTATGECDGPVPAGAKAIEPGIGECELVRLKGKPPTDVLVGESGRGGREVQVLYSEPGGRELYLFVDNRLDRLVR